MNTPQSKHLETDKAINKCCYIHNFKQDTALEAHISLANHARTLEQQRDAALAEAKKWEGLYDEVEAIYMLEVQRNSIGPTETDAECIKRIIEERESLREQLKTLRQKLVDKNITID